MTIDNRFLAWCGATGTLCDAMGGIYMTYELLGGHQGPLGILTRAATYGIIYTLGYGLAFGPAFGAVAGVGLGGVLAFEFWRIARHQRLYKSSPLFNAPLYAVARGLVLGLAAIKPFGLRFGIVFGILNALALCVIYKLHFAPTYDYAPQPKPVLNRRRLAASTMRGVAIGLAGATAAYFETGNPYSMGFGLVVGLTVGAITAFVTIMSPPFEYWVENLPERRLAIVGLCLIFAGLVLQSVQYLVVLAGP